MPNFIINWLWFHILMPGATLEEITEVGSNGNHQSTRILKILVPELDDRWRFSAKFYHQVDLIPHFAIRWHHV